MPISFLKKVLLTQINDTKLKEEERHQTKIISEKVQGKYEIYNLDRENTPVVLWVYFLTNLIVSLGSVAKWAESSSGLIEMKSMSR